MNHLYTFLYTYTFIQCTVINMFFCRNDIMHAYTYICKIHMYIVYRSMSCNIVVLCPAKTLFIISPKTVVIIHNLQTTTLSSVGVNYVSTLVRWKQGLTELPLLPLPSSLPLSSLHPPLSFLPASSPSPCHPYLSFFYTRQCSKFRAVRPY